MENEFLPDWVSAPGDTISDVLADRGFGSAHLVKALDMKYTDVVNLLRGNISITMDIAEKLEAFLKVPKGFWIERDRLYRSELKRLGYLCAVDCDFQHRQSKGRDNE